MLFRRDAAVRMALGLTRSHVRRRQSRCSIEDVERTCEFLLRTPESGTDGSCGIAYTLVEEAQLREFHCCSISDFLGPDELSVIFSAILHTDWLSTLMVCRSWNKIATRTFKERILTILSHSWTGKNSECVTYVTRLVKMDHEISKAH